MYTYKEFYRVEYECLIHPKDCGSTHSDTGIWIASCQASEDLTGKGDKRAEILKVKYLYKVKFIGVCTVFIFPDSVLF